MTNFLGTLIITAYVATGHLAANNKPPVQGITCAGPRSIPLNTRIYVDGIGWRVITDRLNKRFTNRVDLFFGTNLVAAKQFGKQEHNVWIVQQNK
jgi:3D (Asp-Asp-Asp) domain-containing protein